MKRIIDEGIVLRRVNYGESDRVVTLLTKENGKITVFAKGVRKQKSRLSGGIELLGVSEIGYLEGKSDLKTLISANSIRNFDRGIVVDLSKTKLVFDSLKRVDKLSDENAGHEYFKVLVTYLACIADDSYECDVVESWFRLKLLDISGVLGEIEVDGETSGSDYGFDYDKQQFRADGSGNFTKDDIKLLRILKNHHRPIRLEKAADSRNRVLTFTASLLALNLT